MITVLCSCGKQILGSEALAGETALCPKCGQLVTFPARRQPVAVPAGLLPEGFDLSLLGGSGPAPAQDPEAPPAVPPRWGRDSFYWVLLLALLPLVLALVHADPATPKQRLLRTLDAHPELRPRVEALLRSETATLEDLFKVLPGHRLDDLAHLPRDTQRHWAYAGLSAAGFFVLVGLVLARRVTSAGLLVLAGLFTATFGIAFLFLLHDFIGHGYQLALEPDENFLTNLLGFVFVVGLGEELSKALPVVFYVRTFRSASWRGACLWGMASGVGFGVAEGISYAAERYNGVAGGDAYLIRFASCVALHAVWSASVGITLFQSRRLVGRLVVAVFYGGDVTWQEAAWPILRVLGVAMFLHGLYDTLLTQDMILPALLTALASFAWLGWQIETCREQEREAAAELAAA